MQVTCNGLQVSPGCPSVLSTPQQPLEQLGEDNARPRASLSALEIAEKACPGHTEVYLFIYSFTREGRRLEANHFNEELSYLTMQNKVLHDTATFQVSLFKNELPNKEC